MRIDVLAVSAAFLARAKTQRHKGARFSTSGANWSLLRCHCLGAWCALLLIGVVTGCNDDGVLLRGIGDGGATPADASADGGGDTVGAEDVGGDSADGGGADSDAVSADLDAGDGAATDAVGADTVVTDTGPSDADATDAGGGDTVAADTDPGDGGASETGGGDTADADAGEEDTTDAGAEDTADADAGEEDVGDSGREDTTDAGAEDTVGEDTTETEREREDRIAYNEALFAATHNSYSGDHGGARGTLRRQLDGGVRFVEIDFHENDFGTWSYRVGHDGPGDEVSGLAGDPTTDALRAWLEAVAGWSDRSPGHAPITIGLDAKDDLTDNPSNADGNLGALNALLESVFGAKLYRARDYAGGEWPTIGALRDRVLVVLSGHEGSRIAYRRDRGGNPSVAVNASGRIVEVHDNGGGDLWYWAGQIEGDGRVRWYHHARYDSGDDPAVALNADGVLVEVHEDPDSGNNDLWYRVGRLGDDYRIAWPYDGGRRFPGNDEGINPSIRFLSPGGLTVRGIHQSQGGDHDPWFWDGVVEPATGTVHWNTDTHARADRDPYPTHEATAGAWTVRVGSQTFPPFDGGSTLTLRVGDGPTHPLTWDQVAFVEVQRGGSAQLAADALSFFAASASGSDDREWAAGQRSRGGVVRLWGANREEHETAPPVNFAATDFPYSPWHTAYCAEVDCVE